MKKDPHTKRQKQIRMTDELRERFDEAVKNSGLSSDQFIERLLDRADKHKEPSTDELLSMLRRRLR
jgi:DNA-binding MarR family transcriptional regulator